MVVECSWSKSQLLFGLTGGPCNWAVEHSSTSRPTLKVMLRHHRTSFQPSQNTMDRLDLSSMYSMKNIPHPGCFEYFKLLVLKMEHFNSCLRWKTYFLQNPEKKVESDRELVMGELHFYRSSSGPSLKKFERSFGLSVPGPRIAHHYRWASFTFIGLRAVRALKNSVRSSVFRSQDRGSPITS